MEVVNAGPGQVTINDTFAGMDPPRVRHITGIRIHQLTLPQSLSLASKLKPESTAEVTEFPILGESSRLSSSPSANPETVIRRRSSASKSAAPSTIPPPPSTHAFNQSTWPRQRSTSSSTLAHSPSRSPLMSPSLHPPRVRTSRPRAPTLAGEAIEHALSLENSTGQLQNVIIAEDEATSMAEASRKLARCFIVLKVPRLAAGDDVKGGEKVSTAEGYAVGDSHGVPLPKKTSGDKFPNRPISTTRTSSGQDLSRSSSSSSVSTSPTVMTSPAPRPRPSLSSSSSQSSVSRATSPPTSSSSGNRNRTSSLQPSKFSSDDSVRQHKGPGSAGHAPTSSDGGKSSNRLGGSHIQSRRGVRTGLGIRNSNGPRSVQTAETSGKGTNGSRSPSSPTITLTTAEEKGDKLRIMPFYISPIHAPSTHPRFAALSPETDFAQWLTVEESASHIVEMDVWIEEPAVLPNESVEDDFFHEIKHVPELKWTKMDDLSGLVDLSAVERLTPKTRVLPNTVQFTFSTDPRSIFVLPLHINRDAGANRESNQSKEAVSGVVERSLRETRMKKGVGVGGLHQLVNIQAVISDTERGISQVQSAIERLLREDIDRRALRRDISQRADRVKWVQSKIDEVAKTTREAQARITLRQQGVDGRRQNLAKAYERDKLELGMANEMEGEIAALKDRRHAILPIIHRLRALHVQTLDGLFPIQPLSPSTLLYSILQVPLPIPIGPKDPAPPLTLPSSSIPEEGRGKVDKIDERSTATALGYVAMVLQILGGLVGWGGVGGTGGGGGLGGLPYPVTCAGSRSLVKDVVSIMQGLRSFPLYSKGVERYRYEYAVFLLNKNIELLMQESNIRSLDMRHTLPNLKNLLLTLSSPVLPSDPESNSASNTYYNSRTSSRQTSRAWSQAMTATPAGSPGALSPRTSIGDYVAAGKDYPMSPVPSGIGRGVIATPSPLTKVADGRRRSMLARQSPSERVLSLNDVETEDEDGSV